MLTYSISAVVAGSQAEANAWAHEIAELVTAKTNAPVNVSARLGGRQEIIWISLHDDYPAFEASQAKIVADADYARLIKAAVERRLFVPGSVETAFWLPI